MKLIALFKAAVASATIAGATVAGGYAGQLAAPRINDRLNETASRTTTPLQQQTAAHYHLRLDTLAQVQADIENSTEQEEESQALDEAKKGFATDVVLNRNISETDFAALAARFNPLSEIDTIRLRSYNFDAGTVSRRDECLAVTPASNDEWGADRYAYAQRVETCMIEKFQHRGDGAILTQKLATAGGAGIGFALSFGFSMGYALRGNRRLKAVKPA